MKDVNAAIKTTQTELKGVTTLLKLDPKNVELITQKQKLLSAAVIDTKDKLDALKMTQQKIDDGSIDATEEQYRDLQREIASTESRLKTLSQQHVQFASVSAVQLQAVGREFQSIGKKMTEAGQALLPLTAAIGAVGVASVAASIQFESSFAGVKKTVDATTEQLEELAEASRQAAMVKPVDVNDINFIMELGGQLGIAVEYLDKFASVIGDLDVATNLNLEDASLQLSQFMNIMGTATTDIDRLGATIVGLGNNSATTESAIVEMAMRIAGAGGQIGLTEAQVLGLAATLSSVGIEAQMGGSAISRTMSEIDVAVATNSESLEDWANAAGVSAQEFAAAWEEDAAAALTMLFAGMEEAVASGQNVNLILQELGINELRQTDTLKRLTSAAQLMNKTMNIANVSWEENTALVNEATQRYQTTESRLLMLKNQVVDIGISLGNGLKGALLAVMEALQPVLDGIQAAARAFEDADPAVQALVMGAVGLTAALGPMLIVTGKITEGVGSLMVALGKSASALAAKAAATSGDTAAMIANEAAAKKNVVAVNAQIVRNAVKEATDVRLAATTAAKTAATAADTAAMGANTAATIANGTAASAATVRVAALTVATKAKTVAATAATVAQLAWNAAMSANPVGAVVLAVSALVGVIGALGVAVTTAAKNQQSLTVASQEQKEKVEELQASYDGIVAAQGEHSDAAVKAKQALDEETAAFQDSRETLDEFMDRCENTVSAHEEMAAGIRESGAEADAQAGKILVLADRIEALASVEGKSAEEKMELTALTTELNTSCAELNLTYDEQNDALSMNVEAIQAAAKAEADRLRSAAAMESYSDLVAEQVDLEMQLAEAQENLAAETRRNVDAWGRLGNVQVYTSQAQTDLEGTVESLTAALADNESQQQQALEISADYATRQSVLAQAIAEVESGALTAEEAAAKYSAALEGGLTVQELHAQITAKAAEEQQALAAALSEMESQISSHAESYESFGDAMADAGISVEGLAVAIEMQGQKFKDAKEDIAEYSSQAISAFDKIADSSKNSLSALQESLDYNLEATQNWNENLEAVFSRTGVSFSQEFVSAVRAGGVEQYGTALAEMVNLSDEELQKISDSFARNGQAGVESYLLEQRLLVLGAKEPLTELSETTAEALGAATDAAAEAGENTGAAYTENLTASIANAPAEVKTYIGQLETEIAMLQSSAAGIGADTGIAYTDNLKFAISTCPAEVRLYISQLESQLQEFQTEAGQYGTRTGTAYGGNTASAMQGQAEAVSASAATLRTSAQAQLDQLPASASATGTLSGGSFSSGILAGLGSVVSSAFALKSGAEEQLAVTAASAYGQTAGNEFGAGIGSAQSAVAANAETIAACCRQWSAFGSLARFWGWDAGAQFAAGLSSTTSLVRNAATAIASAARAILHFSVPDEGPLADADEYGPDFGMLIADGLLSKVDDVRNAAATVAQAAKDEMNGSFSGETAWGEGFARSIAQGAEGIRSIASASQGALTGALGTVPGSLMALHNAPAVPAGAMQLAGAGGFSAAPTYEQNTSNSYSFGDIHIEAREMADMQTIDDFVALVRRAKTANPIKTGR